MKAISYMRVSTENQKQEGTIDIQRKEIEKYAKQNGIELVAEFADDGISGAIEQRQGLAEMYNYLDEHKNIQTIVIFKLDRLSRDLRQQENILYDLGKKNIHIYSVKEPDLSSDDPSRVLMRQILGSFAQYEKSMITLRLSLGRLNKARKGGYAGGCPATGYKVENKQLLVDEDNAKIVRKIFYMRKRKKMSYKDIADKLNDLGLKTIRRSIWYKSSVRQIVENKVYQGLLEYKNNRTKRIDLVIV